MGRCTMCVERIYIYYTYKWNDFQYELNEWMNEWIFRGECTNWCCVHNLRNTYSLNDMCARCNLTYGREETSHGSSMRGYPNNYQFFLPLVVRKQEMANHRNGQFQRRQITKGIRVILELWLTKCVVCLCKQVQVYTSFFFFSRLFHPHLSTSNEILQMKTKCHALSLPRIKTRCYSEFVQNTCVLSNYERWNVWKT